MQSTPPALSPRSGLGPHCVAFRDGRRHALIEDLSSIGTAMEPSGHVVWLDLIDPTPDQLSLLKTTFDLHPLAVEDAVTKHERPKIDVYEDYLFIIIHPLTWQGEHMILHEMAIFAGAHFLVTIHNIPAYRIAEVEHRWQTHDGALGADSGFLLYTLLDTIVDGYFLISDRLEEWNENLQRKLFAADGNSDATLKSIFQLRNDIQKARRAVVPVRDILLPIVRGDIKVSGSDHLAYYRDVYDHAIRMIDQIDSARDLVTAALEVHLSVVANRQNEVSKQLTLIATVFLPLTYITGFFGQNFSYLTDRIGGPIAFYLLCLGSQIVCAAILIVYFRRKSWL